LALLSFRLCLSSGRWPSRFLGSFLLQQRQRIRCIEGVLTDGLLRRLAGVAQGYIHPAITCQDNRPHIIEYSLPVFRAQLGISFNGVSYLPIGEVFLFAESLGFEVSGRYALFDQEASDAVDSALGERLIEFH
jgi:hypothetical protein